jgi:hypothetical protein
MTIIPQCINCKHLLGGKEFKCLAFPAGVPIDILLGKIEHDKVLKDQKGTLIFEETAKK